MNWAEDFSPPSSEVLGQLPSESVTDAIPSAAIEALAAKWDAHADEIEATAKAYNCRSTDSVRIAYIKQAQRLRMCAAQLRALIATGGDDANQGA